MYVSHLKALHATVHSYTSSYALYLPRAICASPASRSAQNRASLRASEQQDGNWVRKEWKFSVVWLSKLGPAARTLKGVPNLGEPIRARSRKPDKAWCAQAVRQIQTHPNRIVLFRRDYHTTQQNGIRTRLQELRRSLAEVRSPHRWTGEPAVLDHPSSSAGG